MAKQIPDLEHAPDASRAGRGPEGAGPGQDMVGQLAQWTSSAPLLGALGDISLTLALRWLLWLLAVVLSLVGLGAGILGTGLGFAAVGGISNSITAPLDSASMVMADTSHSISAFGLMAANVSNSTGEMAAGLRNISAGLQGAQSGLRFIGQGQSADQLATASANLQSAAGQLDAAGVAGGDATLTLEAVSIDLAAVGHNIQTAKEQAQGGLFYLQLGVLALGAAVEALFGGLLLLALAYGPPKKERKAA